MTRVLGAAAPRVAPNKENLLGIVTMAAGNALLVVNDTIVKLAASQLPLSEVIALRAVAATVFLFIVLRLSQATGESWPRPSWALAARAVLELGASFAYLYALQLMPIGDLAGLFQILPLAMLAGAALVFKERIGWQGWAATFAGLAGAILIVRPGFATAGSAIGAAAATLAALAIVFQLARDLLTRALPAGLPAPFISGTSQVAMFAGGLCLAPFDGWTVPPPLVMAEIAAAAALLALANNCLVIAMRSGRIALVAPFRYAGLLTAVLAGLAVWAEFPDTWSLIGSGIITASGLYSLWHSRNSETRITASTPEIHR